MKSLVKLIKWNTKLIRGINTKDNADIIGESHRNMNPLANVDTQLIRGINTKNNTEGLRESNRKMNTLTYVEHYTG